MSQVIKINHPLKRYEKQLIRIETGMTLAEIRKMPEITNTLKTDADIAISLNGEIIPFEKWSIRKVKEEDFILLVPWVAKGDDEKAIMNMVVMIAVMFAAPGLLGAGGLGLTGITYAAAYVGVAVGTAMIVSALTPRPSSPSQAFNEQELSQSFGWAPATIQRQGIPRPRWYGLNKMYGNVSQAFTRITGATTNLQRLYVLIDLGVGPFREVVVRDTLKLNTQVIANFDDVFSESRRGLLRQKYISYFEKTRVEFATAGLPILIKNGSPKIYEAKNADFDDIEIDLAFPSGLWDGTGAAIANHTVNITIEVKITTSSIWNTLKTEDITAGTTDKVIRSYSTIGVITIDRGSKYQIRVTKNTAEKDSVQWGDDLFLDRIREVTDEQFTYPRAALVGIKALATEQLSGAIGFSCLSRGLYIVDYTDSGEAIKYSTNPGLILADILTQPVYSGEYSPWHDLNLMLNFNGVDAAVATIDNSEKGHTVNFTGTAQLDTAEKKFGTAALLLDGDSDDVNIANDGQSFDVCKNIIDDWTIDFFVKFADHTGTVYLVTQPEDINNRWFIAHVHGDGWYFQNCTGGVIKLDISEVGEISDTNWHHIALCKVGADVGLYVDEVQVGYDLMVSGDTNIYDGNLFIGQYGEGGGWFQGHIDHLRIIKQNIFNAAPNVGLTDTITEPAAEYTDPGNSFVVERYDGYDSSELDLPAFEALVDWCDEVQINPTNFAVYSITKEVNAVINSTSQHDFVVGDTILFRGMAVNGMTEIPDGITATVIKVTNKHTFTIDLDTSAYSTYSIVNRLLYHFEGADGDDFTNDSSPQGHDLIAANFINDAQVSTTEKKFGNSSLYVDGTGDLVIIDVDSAAGEFDDFDILENLTDDWSIEVQVKHDNIDDEVYIAQSEDADNYWMLWYSNGDGPSFTSKKATVVKIDITGDTEIADADFHHVLVAKVGDDIGVYLDGVQVGYDLMVAGDADTLSGYFGIGARPLPPALEFEGYLDEVRIVKGNPFNAAPNVGVTDTITPPTSVHTATSGGTVERLKARFDFNGGFDTETTMWDAALKVCEICRCVPYFKGSKISVAIDRAGDAVFAYTSGNIIKDSFRQIFIPLNERANQIEVHYRDKSQDYQRQPFTLMNPDVGNPTAKARLDLFGITDEELAERIANNMLLKNQHIKTIARFSADIDSIASEIGDPILAPIDATKYGQLGDGRILSAVNVGNAIITVPGTFDWDDADWDGGSTAYRLMVKTADDVIETKSIIDVTEDSAGTETDITVDGVFTTTPVKGDLWAAGIENYEIKKYRVINLRQDDKQRVEVTAIEYVDAIYADD